MRTSVYAIARMLAPPERDAYNRLHSNTQVAIRDAYDERMAICTVDGGQTEEQAHRIALAEVAGMVANRRSNA